MAQIVVTDPSFGYNSYLDCLRRIDSVENAGGSELLIDLFRPTFFYPDGVAPLIATVRSLESSGWRVHVISPSGDMGDYFETVGWKAALEGGIPPILGPERRTYPWPDTRIRMDLMT